jgi:hypothetical protein
MSKAPAPKRRAAPVAGGSFRCASPGELARMIALAKELARDREGIEYAVKPFSSAQWASLRRVIAELSGGRAVNRRALEVLALARDALAGMLTEAIEREMPRVHDTRAERKRVRAAGLAIGERGRPPSEALLNYVARLERVYRRMTGRRYTLSRTREGDPAGPALEFLRAALAPIKRCSDETIFLIIRRVRASS